MPITGASPVTPGFYDAYVCVRDKKPQNTDGGTFTSGAWRTRVINDEQADTANICTIFGNQITLAAGTYQCLISCPALEVAQHQTRLYNITDAAVLLVGTSEYAAVAGAVGNRSFIVGQFTVAAGKALEIQHYCNATKATNGFGARNNRTDEIYTVAVFQREA